MKVQDLLEQELLEMANLFPADTGIPDIVIWVGPHPRKHYMRIKVSNVPNKANINDSFTITIPKLRVIGKPAAWITPVIIGYIKQWIIQNELAIKAHSFHQSSTREFLDSIRPIKI